ncbi:GCN5L1 domain-containing protein [Naegleria gruberi]|uniref:Biogenesis of lysosome-related organelles complex 1 subunit 1 n=1 Tax=Naegleria gruberi TaxID=5762 RepID=D2V3J5_NAEGR|nr:GCN5L1 domain-containing protein [Naegleria gruberi]EFC48781.1 GCN5L1 domain-containing protein [Naegleria gruberi]|eukprot:XP_002681525.1 GCN5L1 domain-containing protein [Naegleria gruberi strain NEG-M]
MLSHLIKEHNQRQQKVREENDKRRHKAKDSLQSVSHELIDQTNSDVIKVFQNQQMIENEAKHLHAQVEKFNKQTTQWIQTFQQLNQCVKELGDVENWANHINNDIKYIVNNIEKHQKTTP